MGDEIWDEHQYKNWVRGAKGLEFLQDGLKDFVGDKAPVCRDQQLQTISPFGSVPQCNQCTSQNLLPEHASGKKACDNTTCIEYTSGNCFGSKPRGRRKCPNGVCSKLYDAIVLDHRYKSPLWKGTDPSTWCSDPSGWMFAKCFQAIPGPATSAQDTDAAGLLSFIINSRSMQNWLTCNHMGLKNMCLFQKAKDIRNDILHKAKMELDDKTLDGYLDVFITVLQDPKHLVTYTGSQDAVNKLTQLKCMQIHISKSDETKSRKIRDEALAELEETTQKALQEIRVTASTGMAEVNIKTLEAKQELKDTTSSVLSEVNKIKSEAVHEIKDTASSMLSDVNKSKSEAVHEIMDTANSGMSDVLKTKSEAVHEIKDTASIGMSDVNKTKSEAVHEIMDTASKWMSDVLKTKSEAVHEIKDTASNSVSDVNNKKSEAVHEIKDTINSGLSDVLKTKYEAVHEIKDTASGGLSDVLKTKSEAVQEIKDTASSGMSDVLKTQSEAVHEIKDTISSGLSDVNIMTTQAVQKIEGAKSNALEEFEKQHRMIVTPDRMKSMSSLDVNYCKPVSAVSDSRGQKEPGILERVMNFFSFGKSRHKALPVQNVGAGSTLEPNTSATPTLGYLHNRYKQLVRAGIAGNTAFTYNLALNVFQSCRTLYNL